MKVLLDNQNMRMICEYMNLYHSESFNPNKNSWYEPSLSIFKVQNIYISNKHANFVMSDILSHCNKK